MVAPADCALCHRRCDWVAVVVLVLVVVVAGSGYCHCRVVDHAEDRGDGEGGYRRHWEMGVGMGVCKPPLTLLDGWDW